MVDGVSGTGSSQPAGQAKKTDEPKTVGWIGKKFKQLKEGLGLKKETFEQAIQKQTSEVVPAPLSTKIITEHEEIHGATISELKKALDSDDPALIEKLLTKKSVSELLGIAVESGMNVLHLACSQGKEQVVKAILAKSNDDDIAALTKKTSDGRTALHHLFYAEGKVPDSESVIKIVDHFTDFCGENPTRYPTVFNVVDKTGYTSLKPLEKSASHTEKETQEIDAINQKIDSTKRIPFISSGSSYRR